VIRIFQNKTAGFPTSLLIILFTLSFFSGCFSKTEPRQCGVSWVAGRQVTEEDFKPLVENHVNWIVQTPFGWQRGIHSPSLKLSTGGGNFWGERDAGLETTTKLAKQFGIKTLLKPHIWLTQRNDGEWRGQIEMLSEEDWQSWFDSYRKFILHYARLAEKNDIEALCIGTELHATAVQRENDWRKLIAEIRKIYSGKLTYAANWYLEFAEIKFWDALDFIGVQAYFPLTKIDNPPIDTLKAGWKPHFEAIEKVSKAFNKPVVFTEIGYRASANASIEPWIWPRRSPEPPTEDDLQTQVNCYEAFFQTFWKKDWVLGAYFWKWFPKARQGRVYGKGFSPQNKPAEQVMSKWYAKNKN